MSSIYVCCKFDRMWSSQSFVRLHTYMRCCLLPFTAVKAAAHSDKLAAALIAIFASHNPSGNLGSKPSKHSYHLSCLRCEALLGHLCCAIHCPPCATHSPLSLRAQLSAILCTSDSWIGLSMIPIQNLQSYSTAVLVLGNCYCLIQCERVLQ